MQNPTNATEKFEFGRALYDASQRFDSLSDGKRQDYQRSFMSVAEKGEKVLENQANEAAFSD